MMTEIQVILFMVGWMIVVVLAMWLLSVGLRRRKHRKITKAMQEWPSTKGFVHFSKVERKRDSDSGDTYVVQVHYVYLVDNQSYERQFETESFARERDAAEKLPLYARGKEVTVYYNSANPEKSHCDLEALE